MTAAPKAAHKSPAQVKAAKAFASGGRAAQARTRAAAIKKTGKPPPVSKKRHTAARKWAAAGRAAQAARRQGKKPPAPRKKAALPTCGSTWTGPAIWLPGCNDELPTCHITAIANHLLAATGIVVSDAEILKLHEHAGGDGGSTLANALEAAEHHGLGGHKLLRYILDDETTITPGLIYGVQTRRGYHAVLAHPYGMVSWGMVLPFSGEPWEAWHLEWESADGPS